MSLIGKTTDIYNFKKVIDDIVDTNLINKGITKYISAKVISINSNNTVNVYIPPDTTNVINGLANKTGELLYSGDSVELCAKNGSVKNSWVAVKHGIGTVGGEGSSDYDSLPIGSVIPFSGNKAPDGYLFCMGQEVSRTERSDLFALIGTTYGEGDGSTTFNLPNLCGKIPVGLDTSDISFDSLGKTGGEKTHTLNINEMPSHNHIKNSIGWVTSGGFWVGSGTYTTLDFDKDTGLTGSTGGSQPHNNLQPYITLNYIIKAYGTAVLKGNILDTLDNDSVSNAPSIHAVNEGLLDKYSTDEIVVGRWLDNKKIYKKTYIFENLSTGLTSKVINLANMETLVRVYGSWYDPTTIWQPIPCVTPDFSSDFGIGINNIRQNNVDFNIGTRRSTTNKVYLTFEYTKTTD